MTTGPQYSTSAANNTVMDAIAISDSMSPASVDNALRSIGASIGKLTGRQIGLKGATNTPPGSPTAGDRYLVTATATGAWATYENYIAVYVDTASPAWEFVAPDTGAVVAYLDGTFPVLRMYDGTDWGTYINTTTPGHRTGLAISNNSSDSTNDIDIAAGSVASSDTVPVLLTLSSAITKRLDAAWAVGTGNGGLDTGSIANTTYFVWIIARSDTGVVDALFSASATSPTMPASYDLRSAKPVGVFIRSGGSIVQFVLNGENRYTLDVFVRDVSGGTIGTSATLHALSVPNADGIEAIISASAFKSAAGPYVLITDPAQTDTAASSSVHSFFGANGAYGQAALQIGTDSSGQIRSRSDLASVTLNIVTRGWVYNP